MLNNPTLILLFLNLGGVALSGGLALTGLLGDFREVMFTGIAGVALLTITLGIAFLFLGRLKTLGAVLGLLILIPLCILEMCLYSWNAPYRTVAKENPRADAVEVVSPKGANYPHALARVSSFPNTIAAKADFSPSTTRPFQTNMNPSRCKD